MKVILDANVIISAFVSRGLCNEILEACGEHHEIVISESLIEEIYRGFIRKVRMPKALAEYNTGLLKESCHLEVPFTVSKQACPDPKDLHVLGLASASKAEYIVSGDRDLWSLKKFEDTAILPPRAFWEILRKIKAPKQQ